MRRFYAEAMTRAISRIYNAPTMTTIKTSQIEVTAAEKGAELQSILGPGGIEYLWQGDPAFWPRRSPLLFPIVGALPGGTFSYAGKTYKLGNHGFAKELEFRATERGPASMRFEAESDAGTLELYPFRFKLAVAYKAVGASLEVGYEVTNADSRRMPFSIGAHPAFRAPLEPGERREDYDLVFERPETVDRHFLNSDNLRTGESESLLRGSPGLPVTGELFERGAIVLKDQVSRKLTLRSRVSGRFVELSFPDFPQLGIWSPKANASGLAPFVCIEPWFGVMPLAGSTQDLERKEAVLSLGPGAVFRASYTIRVG
jgi:galactose mutarotase-like enzyme